MQKTQKPTKEYVWPDPVVSTQPISEFDQRINDALKAVYRVYGRNLGAFFDDVIAKKKAERLKKK